MKEPPLRNGKGKQKKRAAYAQTDKSCVKYIVSRYLSRFFDCLAHPNLSATDQK